MSGGMINPSRLLIVSHDVVGSRMAGPGIRYWKMARAMSDRLEVTLAAPGHAPMGEGFITATYTPGGWETLASLVAQADALLFSGDLLAIFPRLADCGKPLVLDVYDPHTFETVHLSVALPPAEQVTAYMARVDILRRTALAGDFFICATQRQRDYWLGILDVCGRANAFNYSADPTLQSLIDLVPFGLPSQPPQANGSPIKGQAPGIEAGDRVILWGGGLWEWLDPLTLVRAVGRLCDRYANLRLVFFSGRHPNPGVPDMPMRTRAMARSDELGLTNKSVFFIDRWVPHQDWPAYLLDADIGASLHLDTLETRFAFRTRVVDYIWAGLPMVVTGGDETSDLVAHHNLGAVVPPGDVDAVVAAVAQLLDIVDLRKHYQPAFECVRPLFEWKRVCEPIVRFCQSPRLAPDRAAGVIAQELGDTRELHQALAEREAEAQRLHGLVEGYERGKFIRAMRWLGHLRKEG